MGRDYEENYKARFPEHSKLDGVQEQVEACIQFLNWMQEGGFDETLPEGSDGYGYIELCYRPLIKTKTVAPPPERRSHKQVSFLDPDEFETVELEEPYRSEHLEPVNMQIQEAVLRYFGIDSKKLEDEKRQMIEDIRQANSQSEHEG